MNDPELTDEEAEALKERIFDFVPRFEVDTDE